MRRRSKDHEEAPDHDSFLDIVANIVGILVILVVVVTARARQVPVLSIAQPSPKTEKVETARRAVQSLKDNVLRSDDALKRLDRELETRRTERNYMATLFSAAEDEMIQQREQLDERGKKEYDLHRQLTAGTAELERTRQALAAAEGQQKNVVRLDNYPTPLGKTVYGKEVHFRLLNGRITYVPLDELVEEFKGHARANVWKLDSSQSEATETIGPLDGFRMRYTMERVEIPVEQRIETGRTGHVVRLKSFELVPVGSDLGETVEAALQPGSRFHVTLAGADKERTTVTLWTYPDSFSLFRQLKKSLFEQGLAAAARPLPHGVSIGGSPRGSRSSAQ